MRRQIHGLTFTEFRELAAARFPLGAGVANAVYRQAMCEARFEPEALLGEKPGARFRELFRLELPSVRNVVEEGCETGTTGKAVLRLDSGLEYECVRIPMGRGRHTLCVSSQVGCKMGCGFCETGRMGLLRSLTADEIVAQILVARHQLGWNFGRIVFMGMGEALDNIESLKQVLHILTDPVGLQFARHDLTVCTVGKVDGIRELSKLGWKRLNLSISLNAANDDLRSQLMPVNRRTPLADLQAELVRYRPRTNFLYGVNYCLMPGINDSRQDAADVANFCEPLGRLMVNVIPYNPGNDPLCRAPSDAEIDRFIRWLRDEGLPVRRRITKGRRVMAACGQLGNVDLRRSKLPVKRTLPVSNGQTWPAPQRTGRTFRR